MQLDGGCLCGAVRYRAEVLESDVADYCHCRQCRLASGAPVVAWVQVPPARFGINKGAAKGFASSAHSTRWFCPDCGSQLYMTDQENRSVGLTLASLDNPEAVKPNVHGWYGEHLGWLDIADNLPRYPQSPPYDM